jgi:beta-lactamase class A
VAAAGPPPDAAASSAGLLRDYAREPGRSVLVRVKLPGTAWEGGVAADEPRPAASLLKVPLALAVEAAFSAGRLDPEVTVTVEELMAGRAGAGPLRVLDGRLPLTGTAVLGLCLALSDRACATWLLEAVGLAAVRDAAAAAGCEATTMSAVDDHPSAPLLGRTTARDALRLLAAATDESRYPLTANALRNTALNSRIPLGADDLDVRLAHKTGTLAGVANDVAIIDCTGGTVSLAFLTEAQHDTLVSGYEMGICTRALLEAWGLAVRRSRSLA